MSESFLWGVTGCPPSSLNRRSKCPSRRTARNPADGRVEELEPFWRHAAISMAGKTSDIADGGRGVWGIRDVEIGVLLSPCMGERKLCSTRLDTRIESILMRITRTSSRLRLLLSPSKVGAPCEYNLTSDLRDEGSAQSQVSPTPCTEEDLQLSSRAGLGSPTI